MINQLTLFQIGFIKVSFFDLVDIFVMSYLLYKLYLFIRGSRAAQMFVGLVLILIVSLLTRLFDMRGMTWLFDSLKTVWLIAFVIVFQPELRRMLIYVGQSKVIRYFIKVSSVKTFDEVIKSTLELSKRKCGGIIVLLRDMGIKSILETGIPIQAEVSTALITTIFNTKSPLHDGAIIIQNDLIQAAKCILPLSQNISIGAGYGTRHRAGLGLSEESDAVVIIVSEETGHISVAVKGKLHQELNEAALKNLLFTAFNVSSDS